jgi:hypothetical protein
MNPIIKMIRNRRIFKRIQMNLYFHFFEKKIYELAQRTNCLRDMSKPEAKTFARLWNNSQKMIMGPDGKMKNTRGLNYKSDDDS